MNIPSVRLCYKLISKMNMMDHIVDHSEKVCQVAVYLTENLMKKGVSLNRDLVTAAALLHDITNTNLILGGMPIIAPTDVKSGDPLLNDSYLLMAGSAAIDVGLDVGLTWDLFGEARPYAGIPDIGADEFVLHLVHLPRIAK